MAFWGSGVRAPLAPLEAPPVTRRGFSISVVQLSSAARRGPGWWNPGPGRARAPVWGPGLTVWGGVGQQAGSGHPCFQVGLEAHQVL